METFFIAVLPPIVSVLIAVFARTCILYKNKNIPRIVIVLYLALSFVPFLSIAIIFLAFVFFAVESENIVLKENKFNKFWFN